MMRAFTWMAGAILASGCGAAVALTPQDFAFGVPVVTSKDAAVYRIALPLSVYQNTVRDDLGDLRLFNSQNEAVPYSLLRPKPAAQARAGAATLPLFPLRGSSRVVIDGVRLTIDSAGSAVNLQTQRESGINIAVNQYILDGRGFEAAVSALRLVWPETASDYSGRLRIEVSDDLGSWVTLVVGAPIANLHANGQSLVENRVAIPPTRTKFWRISWLGPSPMFELTSVLAEPADGPAESVRATLDITGVPDPADPDAYLFDTGAHLPVSRVNLSLPETNMVNGIELSSRRAPPNPWRTVAYAGFYRIKTHEGEQQNAPIDISIDRDRYWRAKITRGGGARQSPLRLHVEWVPNEVTFLAQGTGPFLLAYGNAAALSAETDLSQIPTATEVEAATLGAVRDLGGAGRLIASPAPFAWNRASLWIVLVLAVVLLGWMALRLSKEPAGPHDAAGGH